MKFKIAIFILVCFTKQAFAKNQQNFYLLKATEASIDVYKNKAVHDPYLEPVDNELDLGSKFNLNLDVVRYYKYKVFWQNTLHFDQSRETGHIKHAGWWYFVGATLIPSSEYGGGVDIFMEHHSRHLLEETRDTHFPVYDRYGVRFNLLKK